MKGIFNHKLLLMVLFSFIIAACEKNEAEDAAAMALEANKKTTVAVVHASALGLADLLQTLTDSAAKVQAIRTYITPIRFYEDNSGYFYVYNYQCVNIAHATQKELEGQNLYDYQDCKGKYVIRELSAAAANGGGFVEFYWVKPGETGEKLKIGYVEPISGTNFFIGSGVYVPE